MSAVDLEKKPVSNIFDGVAPIVKRRMVLFFLVDHSGSMAGTKMGTVNDIMREVVPAIRKIDGGANVDIFVAPLLFSEDCRWMHPQPVNANEFSWATVEAESLTSMGAAFAELAAKLAPDGFMPPSAASLAPAIILLSDGHPTDSYEKGLAKLTENRWFKHAIRVTIAIGNDADQAVLTKFTGNLELVLTPHNLGALAKIIRFVTVTASRVGSRSQGFGGASRQETMLQEVREFRADNPDIEAGDDDWE